MGAVGGEASLGAVTTWQLGVSSSDEDEEDGKVWDCVGLCGFVWVCVGLCGFVCV